MDVYLQKQPTAEDRMEIALANLCAMFFNANRGKDQGPKQLKDFMPFRDPWPVVVDSNYSELDKEVFGALGR
jgi:hypothetical protein